MEKSAVFIELDELISSGENLRNQYLIELCDPIPSKYRYLDDLQDDEYDDEDKELREEYDKYLEQISNLTESYKKIGPFSSVYQSFYTKAYRVVAALAPERLKDFQAQYKRTTGELKSASNYTIYDGLMGISQTFGGSFGPSSALRKVENQVDILKAIRSNLGSALFEIEQTMRMDLFDTELEAAKHLLSRGHLRAAGAVAGVVLEEHLKVSSLKYGFQSRKKAPSIADFNEYLKAEGVIDTIVWRRIQGLADIRNLCDHSKDRSPEKEDVEDLISGVDRVLKFLL